MMELLWAEPIRNPDLKTCAVSGRAHDEITVQASVVTLGLRVPTGQIEIDVCGACWGAFIDELCPGEAEGRMYPYNRVHDQASDEAW